MVNQVNTQDRLLWIPERVGIGDEQDRGLIPAFAPVDEICRRAILKAAIVDDSEMGSKAIGRLGGRRPNE